MTPETFLVVGALLGIVLGASSVSIMWFVSSERTTRKVGALHQQFVDLSTIATNVIEDNIGLAMELDSATVRLSMALDVERLVDPGFELRIPAQRTEWDAIADATDRSDWTGGAS